MDTIKVIIYSTDAHKEPFTVWLDDLDIKTQAIVFERINRVRGGNLGDHKRITGFPGLHEVRINHGPGFRIYFGKEKSTIVILLLGGDKKSQKRDIERAYGYWRDYRGL
ncbi:addiction module killer protein [Candidatus Dependentiae bacterium HGW-Dependentiae-1]|nr:MAG: addiction module killer protein [Candidatus Dependentiae bacterium HGW-Dependentiae-1]